MRILVEPSEYDLCYNVGDMAMTHIAVRRLAALWPEAPIHILTEPSRLLSIFCPGATPVLTPNRRLGIIQTRLLDAAFSRLVGLRASISYVKRSVRRYFPSLAAFRAKLARDQYLTTHREAISQADLLVVSGMGGLTDAFRDYSLALLERIELALEAGVPVVMMGQGIGPLHDLELLARARAVLPHVDLICLREGRAGPSLLHSLGVHPARILTTGDDAVEMAFRLSSEKLGDSLGVSLRAASYAAVNAEIAVTLRAIFQDAARAHRASMVPLPTAKEDVDTLELLVSGYDLGREVVHLENPIKAVEKITSCRLVVTGSYHAAVFALSVGVPAVCLAASQYYIDKFEGLAEQFGTGCEVVVLRGTDWQSQLSAALDRLWLSAEQFRPQLLTAAQRQIALGRLAYRRIYELYARPSLLAARASGTELV